MHGHHMKEIREEAGINKSEMAKVLGISLPTLTKWESLQSDVPLSLEQCENFLYYVSKPEKLKQINEAFHGVSELWQSKL